MPQSKRNCPADGRGQKIFKKKNLSREKTLLPRKYLRKRTCPEKRHFSPDNIYEKELVPRKYVLPRKYSFAEKIFKKKHFFKMCFSKHRPPSSRLYFKLQNHSIRQKMRNFMNFLVAGREITYSFI